METTIRRMIGMTFSRVYRSGEEIRFVGSHDRAFRFWHSQSCCERVVLADICGDLSDLEGMPVLMAEEVSDDNTPEFPFRVGESDIAGWTFYKFATAKGAVTLRWCGRSNGFYSIGVRCSEVKASSLTSDDFV